MKVQKAFAMIVLLVSFSLAVVAVGYFNVQYPQGTDVFTVDNAGNVDADGTIKEGNVLLGNLYAGKVNNVNSSTTAGGDATGTFSALQVVNTQGLGYHNLTDIPTCTGTTKLAYDGTDLSCAEDQNTGNTTEEMQDVTGAMVTGNTETHIAVTYEDGDGTLDFVVSDDWWDSLADMALTDTYIYVGNAGNDPAGVAMSGHASITNTGVVTVSNTAGLGYHNLTDIPTCGAGEVLKFDGTDLSCVTDSTGDTTDSFLNETVNGVETAEGFYNYTSGSTIALSEGSRITGANKLGTNATIDSNGNFVIVLG